MERTLMCDISFYQDAESTEYKPDLGRMKDAGILGVSLRCSENLYRDRMFEYFWGECITHVIPRTVFGFLDYWEGNADKQGKFLADWFKDKPPTRGWLDFERPNGQYPALPSRVECLNQMQNWLGAVDEGMGTESGVYLNLSTIAYLYPIPEDILRRPFWLAWPPIVPAGMSAIEYTRNMTPPAVPFHNMKVWQFTWSGPGEKAGMESKGLDTDWWLGNLSELNVFCGMSAPVVIPPSPYADELKAIGQRSIVDGQRAIEISGKL